LEQLELKTTIRKTTGNSPARALRREGKIPAVLYGQKKEPVLLSVDVRNFERVIKKGSVGRSLLDLPILLFLGATVVSALLADNQLLSITTDPIQILGAVLTFFLIGAAVHQAKQLSLLTKLFLAGAWTRPGAGVHACFISGMDAAELALCLI